MELAHIAREHPDRFARFVVTYEQDQPNGKSFTRYVCSERMTTRELLGLIEQGKWDVLRQVSGL